MDKVRKIKDKDIENRAEKSLNKIKQAIEEAANLWIEGKLEYLPPLTSLYMKTDDIVKYINKRYKKDKQEYLKTGIWPVVHFYRYDNIYNYYYLLKITDPDLELDKYLDVEYDSKEWPKERIIGLIFERGIDIIPYIVRYLKEKTTIPFNTWYKNEIEELKASIPYNTVTIFSKKLSQDSDNK